MRDLISHNGENDENSSDILYGLAANLQEIQNRLMILICEIEDETFVALFIKLNDFIQEALNYHLALKSSANPEEVPKPKSIDKQKITLIIKNLKENSQLNIENLEEDEKYSGKSAPAENLIDFIDGKNLDDEKDFEMIANRDKAPFNEAEDPLAFLNQSIAVKEKNQNAKASVRYFFLKS
jgi:hypothetical protein